MAPLVDGHSLTPEEAIANHRCPETGRSLRGIDVRAHCSDLYPFIDPNNPLYDEARKRQKLLLDYAARQDAAAAARKEG